MTRPIQQDQIIVKDEEIGGIEFVFTITDNDEAIDLTDATVLFVALSPTGITNTKGCEITDATNGIANVVLDAVPFFELGEHSAEIRITKTNEVNISEKFYYTSLDSISIV